MSLGGKKNIDDGEIVSDINMTPLIDIMLVILIIFMVSSSVVIESGLDVDLPQSSAVVDKTNSTMLVISISKAGEIALQGEKIPSGTDLQGKISAALAQLKTEAVMLEADGESQLSLALNVMDTAKLAGAKTFSIGARLKEAGER